MDFLSEIITRENFVIEYGSHVMDSIMIVLEGKFSFSVHGRDFVAVKNNVCVFPKDTLFERKVDEKIRCIYIQFDNFPMPLQAGVLNTTDTERTESSIKYLADAVEEKNELLIKHFLMDILFFYKTPDAKINPADSIVSECIRFFGRNYRENINLDMLSQKFSVSKQGLIRKFKKHTRKTPMEYVNFIRINHGKLMLRDTTMPIGEIAEKCGFENIYYFSSRFKAVTGVSPSVYRMENAR